MGRSQAVRHTALDRAPVGSNPTAPAKCEPLAQLVEHLTFNQGVPGSSPGWLTKIIPILRAAVAELADALDLGSSGVIPWRFKSSLPHQNFAGITQW